MTRRIFTMVDRSNTFWGYYLKGTYTRDNVIYKSIKSSEKQNAIKMVYKVHFARINDDNFALESVETNKRNV